MFNEKLIYVIAHNITKSFVRKTEKEKLISEPNNCFEKIFLEWENNLVINKTDIDFSKKELDILKQGFKMSFTSSKIPIEEIVVGIEAGTKCINFRNRDTVRNECLDLIEKNQKLKF